MEHRLHRVSNTNDGERVVFMNLFETFIFRAIQLFRSHSECWRKFCWKKENDSRLREMYFAALPTINLKICSKIYVNANV